LLGSVLYIYLHLELIRFFKTLANSMALAKGSDIPHEIDPWVGSDFALRLCAANTTEEAPLPWLSMSAAILLVWVSGPLILTAFWWRSMPAHNEWLTLLIALLILFCIFVGYLSFWTARQEFRDGNPPKWRRWSDLLLGSIVAVAILLLSWLRTDGGFTNYLLYNQPIAAYSERRSPTVNGSIFNRLEDWAETSLLARALLGSVDFSKTDADFAFFAYRDFRGAFASLANFSDLQLFGSRFAYAYLPSANFSRSSLDYTDFRQAHLRSAILDNAYIANAVFTFTNLEGARFERALIWDSDFRGADLTRARLSLVDFRGSDLKGIDWHFTAVENVNFHGADLRGAKNLLQKQLDSSIGDESTLLPDHPAPDTKEPYFVWSCWPNEPDGLAEQVLSYFKYYTTMDPELVRESAVCSPGQLPRKVGTH
jgi:uncharacterized protein YjbI with pentapeptide repeats